MIYNPIHNFRLIMVAETVILGSVIMAARRKTTTVKSKSQPGLKVKRVVSTIKPKKPKKIR